MWLVVNIGAFDDLLKGNDFCVSTMITFEGFSAWIFVVHGTIMHKAKQVLFSSLTKLELKHSR